MPSPGEWICRVAEIDLRHGERGFFGVKIGDELAFLRFEDGFGAALGFDGDFVALQRGLCLFEVGLPRRELRGKAFVVGDGGFDALLGRGLSR